MSSTNLTGPREPQQVIVRRVILALLLPLFFAIAFPLAFATATHAPSPHDLPLAVVGPDQVVGKIATSLNSTDRFRVTQTDVAAAAREDVRNRTADGAILVAVTSASQTASATKAKAAAPTFAVTTYIASAGGRSASAVVQSVGQQVAQQLGTTSAVVDVAPLAVEDSLGTNLFYLLTYISLAGYMVIILMGQLWAGSRLSTRYAVAAIAAVAAPLIVFALSSIFVGDYGADFGTIAALLGTASLYVFTVSALAILIQQFLGREAQFGVMALIVFLNFPSAGGVSPESMLPPFWQGVHNVYFGSGAFEAFRSIVYFGGTGASRWLLQLLAWTVGLVLLTVVVHLAQLLRRRLVPADGLPSVEHTTPADRGRAAARPALISESKPLQPQPAHTIATK